MMVDVFINDLESVYKKVEKYNERKYIDEFKVKWNIKESIGEFYENISLKESRKKKGRYYTPFNVVDYISENIVSSIKFNGDFNIKILDPSCGGGYFLIDIYYKLESILCESNYNNKEKHIIDNIIYGYDIDKVATIITTLELFCVSGYLSKNIINGDFLLEENNSFNYIVGNPPYIGHKVLDATYRKSLSKIYGDVFYEKGDLSYCFFKKSIALLSDKGELTFFTSRYILESLYGEGLRSYIKNNTSIKSIIDFYGIRIVKGAGVDNIIINIKKDERIENIDYYRIKIEGKDKGSKVFDDIVKGKEVYTKHIVINQNELSSGGWKFLNSTEKSIISKIESKCSIKLCDICESFQGIITGKDEAFIINKSISCEIEGGLLKPWIKGKQVSKFNVEKSEKLIIYSDLINEEKDYPLAISYLSRYKEKLEKRRECLKGSKKWYGIQWGRRCEYFNGEKIVFPYKSSSNRFAYDKGNYYSADIYSLRIKEGSDYSYEFLECILNSSIYEFYIKTTAKKLGDDLYEYYPNKIMKIYIPYIIEDIIKAYDKSRTNIKEIDEILNKYFNITDDEFNVVKSWCN